MKNYIFLRKKFILCKVSTHIGIKWSEESDKTAKQAIDMPGMTTTRLIFTDYLLSDHQEN